DDTTSAIAPAAKDGPPADAVADQMPALQPPARGIAERSASSSRDRIETKTRDAERKEPKHERDARIERTASSRSEPERKSTSSTARQHELEEDKKREKEARARKERMWERQQAEQQAQRRSIFSQPQVRYYRAGSNEPQRGPRFTDAFR
ncbi:MAG: hypothetical protein JWR80_3956, partial [Bradyrhizobium sp.]|nr:hypothetical protein [Bradyrhizobium sp.]